ncbi:hypothetical protein QT972_33450 [Microcoleus sp. herbarium7]|uniref:hypothetical protein n=1 Tax=Microcoleus sp. herbarium7 TaxID=3055435 RepID=UPI002FD29A25
MSAGSFSLLGKYEASEGGLIYRIRVQPETISANNPVPAGDVNGIGSVRVGGGNRQIGIKARSITVRWSGTVPDGYLANGLVRIPIFTPATYNALILSSPFTYLGQPTVVVSKNGERVR